MNAKQLRALAKTKAIAAKRKAKELNDKADPYADRIITRVTSTLVASPYTAPIIILAMIGVVVFAIMVLL